MGSTLGFDEKKAVQAGRIAVCTTLSAASGGVVTVCFDRLISPAKEFDVSAMCNGILAGLVSITAGCVSVPTWAAVIHGVVGGIIYVAASRLVLHCRIDDPLDAFAVHGACGAWGVIGAALFSSDRYSKGGLFYGQADPLGAAIVFILAVTSWSASMSLLVFGVLHKLKLLRSSPYVSVAGAGIDSDRSVHGGQPYLPSSQLSTA
mmetsp:Transcript_42723/g.100134  ORF Transcript_42723/g.100134 Transcript_42723/m.100134 type:complete len:205 (-) Transcript_42723:199-813(-)